MSRLLPLLAALLALGILAGSRHPGQALPLLAVAAGLGGAGVLLLGRPRVWVLCLLLATIAAGAALAALGLRRPADACQVSRHTGREVVRLLGTVDGPPRFDRGGHRQRLEAHRLISRRGTVALCGGVELRRPPSAPLLVPGELVLLRTRLRGVGGGGNPGAPHARLRHLSEGVGAAAWAPEEAVVVLERRKSGWLQAIRQRLRRVLARGIDRAEDRAVVAALVLGEREMGADLRRAYARAGMSHLLAVSGLHLSLLALGALALLRGLLRRLPAIAARTDPSRLATPLAAGVAVLYTALAGAPPSAVRACIMACAGFLGRSCGRAPDGIRPLALAALGLLAWDPLNLFRPGFQLSFAAVLGLTLASQRTVADEWPRRGAAGLFRRGLRALRDLVRATLAATVFTAPLVAHHFHEVPLIGLLTNLLAVPFTACCLLPLGLLGATLGAVHPAIGEPLLALAGWAAHGLSGLARLSGGLEGAAILWPLGWGWTLALLLGAAALLGPRGWRRRLGALALLGIAALILASLVQRGRPALEAVFLDVGQGESTFVRFPDGFTMLVDGGGSLISHDGGGGSQGRGHRAPYDPGEAQVVPFLRGAGVRRLDLLVLSHPHPDHLGGLEAVVAAVEVGELWLCWIDDPHPGLDRLRARAAARRIPVRVPRLLRRGTVTLRPLGPAGYAGLCADPAESANDNSIVLRLEYGASSLLLTGDIEAEAEARLVRRWGPAGLRATVLKVPHHGSRTSSSAALLLAVAPRLAVISCGRDNPFGFPRPEVLARYRASGAVILRVDQQGAVGIRLQADGAVRWRALVDSTRW